MRLRKWMVVATACGAIACGGQTTSSVAAGATSSGSATGASSSGASGSATGSGGSNAQASTSAASSGAGAAGGIGAGGAGGAPVTLTLSFDETDFFLNCMPFVPPDPLNGSFTVIYQNDDALPASATVTSARIVLTKPNKKLVWTFSVTPASSGIVQPQTKSKVKHAKVPGSGKGAGDDAPCAYCGGQGQLEVVWNNGALSAKASPTNVMCAF